MAKLVNVTVTLFWTTTLEVDDDFILDDESAQNLVFSSEDEFDYEDGSLSPYTANCTLVDEDENKLPDSPDIEVEW